jgi:tetratricopeptide (TPR) repeat protein
VSPRPIELPGSGFEAALLLARQGRFAEALDGIERTLGPGEERVARAPTAATALAELAELALAAGEPGTAERALERALDLAPRFADLHYRHARLLLSCQRPAEARRALDAALRINPRYLAARLERTLIDARDGLVGDAIESLRAMAKDLPVEDAGAFHRGISSLERADWDEADQYFKRALNIPDPGLQRELHRFHALLEEGEPGRAAQLLQELLPRHEEYPDLHYLLGLAELELGHHDDALACFARALELNPEFHAARVRFAHALECLGQTAQAAEQVALVLERDAGNPQALELQRSWAGRRAKRRGIGLDKAS